MYNNMDFAFTRIPHSVKSKTPKKKSLTRSVKPKNEAITRLSKPLAKNYYSYSGMFKKYSHFLPYLKKKRPYDSEFINACEYIESTNNLEYGKLEYGKLKSSIVILKEQGIDILYDEYKQSLKQTSHRGSKSKTYTQSSDSLIPTFDQSLKDSLLSEFLIFITHLDSYHLRTSSHALKPIDLIVLTKDNIPVVNPIIISLLEVESTVVLSIIASTQHAGHSVSIKLIFGILDGQMKIYEISDELIIDNTQNPPQSYIQIPCDIIKRLYNNLYTEKGTILPLEIQEYGDGKKGLIRYVLALEDMLYYYPTIDAETMPGSSRGAPPRIKTVGFLPNRRFFRIIGGNDPTVNGIIGSSSVYTKEISRQINFQMYNPDIDGDGDTIGYMLIPLQTSGVKSLFSSETEIVNSNCSLWASLSSGIEDVRIYVPGEFMKSTTYKGMLTDIANICARPHLSSRDIESKLHEIKDLIDVRHKTSFKNNTPAKAILSHITFHTTSMIKRFWNIRDPTQRGGGGERNTRKYRKRVKHRKRTRKNI